MPDTGLDAAGAIRLERDRFVAFAFAAADLLLEVDEEGRIRYAAGALKSLTHKDAEALTGRPFTELLCDADRALAHVLLTSLKGGGRLSPMMVKLAPPTELNVVLGGCRPPTERETYQITITVLPARLAVEERPGQRDAATGLLKKDEFAKVAEEKLNTGNFRMSLVQVGGLEALRAQADQELGDGFMAAIGRHLRQQSADGDSAGQIGDGKYGVIHDGGFDAAEFEQQITELAEAADMDGMITVDANEVELKANGLSETDAARTVLYAINKFSTSKAGEFTLASLSDGFKQLVAETATRVRGLRGTLESKDFSIVFQPIVDLATRKVHHYEVLSRFTGGGPAEMVHFAEQIGVVAEFDLAVIERAIKVLTEGVAANNNATIAVNISGRSLESEIFAGDLSQLLKPHGDLGSRLMFEITESALITRMTDVQNLVASLRARGFRVCLDDFGAGSSSFHYLNSFPVDFVKIDGKYVRNALDSKRDRAFLKAMASLCRDLGTASIAEMIETEAQANLISDLGVGFAQGYLFGKPAPEMTVNGANGMNGGPAPLSETMNARAAAMRAAAAARGAQPGSLINWK